MTAKQLIEMQPGHPTSSVVRRFAEAPQTNKGIVAINQGDRTEWIVMGFGRGASDIKTHVIVSSLYKGVHGGVGT